MTAAAKDSENSVPRDQFAAQFDAIFKKCAHEYDSIPEPGPDSIPDQLKCRLCGEGKAEQCKN